MKHPHNRQSGFFLIEALVAILIFSLGVLGMVALGGTAMGAQTDARYRTDAAALADELASSIVMNAVRDSNPNFIASLNQFQHRPGTSALCTGYRTNASAASGCSCIRVPRAKSTLSWPAPCSMTTSAVSPLARVIGG